jgi:RNA polymerase sigma-70 factor (ECF subfamily)
VVSSADKLSALLAFWPTQSLQEHRFILWTIPGSSGTSMSAIGCQGVLGGGWEMALMASVFTRIDSASDETLVRSVARKDERAMRVLFARHHRRVFLFLMRLVKDETLAEDVVSEVFLDIWRKAETFKEQSAVSTWLLAIARNKALTAVARRSEVGLDDEVAATLVDPNADPEQALQEKDRSEVLGQCLAQLSPEHGQIISLVYYREKSVREVAEIVGVPEPTVKTRMFYARRRIAELMRAHDVSQWQLADYKAA